jgi:hypothetical protein
MALETAKAVGLLLTVALAGCQQAADAAPDFSCTNTLVELHCTAQGCAPTPAGEFTPMRLSRTNGVIELCAYSGCSDGEPDLTETRGALELIHADLGAPTGAAAIVLDNSTSTATLRIDGFVVPMECDRPE